MSKYKYVFKIEFNIKKKDMLYCGPCYYRSNIIDKISVCQNHIIIDFTRSKRYKQSSDILDTPKSIIRLYLQKALCFYLSVEGNIPKVKRITITCDGKFIPVEMDELTYNWEKCNIKICLNSKISKLFFESDRGKSFYIIMTYFLKAQLTIFSRDCFISAWSSLNCFYTYIYNVIFNKKGNYEKEKLKSLSEYMDMKNMNNSLEKVKVLNDIDFWEKLDWYNCVKSFKNYEIEEIINGRYTDFKLVNLLSKYMISDINSNLSNDSDRNNIIKNSKGESIPKDRLKFLICNYCYKMRCRCVHAEKEYPLFIISEEIETKIEKILTEIILLTVKDLYEEMVF